jgi:hypothetical protein
MPAAVQETNVDPEPEAFTPEQRRERRGVLTHMHNYDGTMRFPEDEYEEDEEGDEIEREKGVADRLLFRRLGSGDTIGSDLLPEESPIGDLRTRIMEERELARIKGKVHGTDPKDVEFNRVARLPYKLRRKEQKKPTIEHQITCRFYFILSFHNMD